MKLKGIWACPDYNDIQLNIGDDWLHFTIANDEVGIYDHPVADYTLTDDTLTLTYSGVHLCLTWNEKDNLTGTAVKDGETTEVVFSRASDTPIFGKPHSALQKAPVAVPEDFGLTAGQLIGQWQSPVPYQCTLIFFPADDGKLDVMLAFGKNPYTPVAVYFEDDTFVFLINDSYNRGRCTIRLENGHLKGTFTQLLKGAYPPVDFGKISDTPTLPENPLAPLDMPRIDILRRYTAYGEPEEPVMTEFVLHQPLPEEITALGFEDYIKDKSGDALAGDALAYACLDFVCERWLHNSYGMPDYSNRTLAECVRYVEEHDCEGNCRCLSLILAPLLRAAGIRAQHVTCMPYEEPFNDCHVVVDCFLPSGKRVMMDPTYHLTLTDEHGEPVSLPRLREILIEGGTLVPCQTFGYHHTPGSLDEYRDYMAKNTIRFEKGRINEDGNDCREPMILSPAGYPIEETDHRADAIVLHDPAAFWGKC